MCKFQEWYYSTLFCCANIKEMDVNTIKEISKKQFNKLIEDEVIGGSYAYGNIPEIGKHSSGFYDVKAYERLKNSDKMNKFSSAQTK